MAGAAVLTVAAACETVIEVEKLSVDTLRRFEPRRASGAIPIEACDMRFCCCAESGAMRDIRSATTSVSAPRVVSNEVRERSPLAVRARLVWLRLWILDNGTSSSDSSSDVESRSSSLESLFQPLLGPAVAGKVLLFAAAPGLCMLSGLPTPMACRALPTESG